ncbi:MAG: MerR family transcriptional regulator [Parvularculales bacterium]
MPKRINGKTYYQTKEAAEATGISRPTLLRWFREGRVRDVRRDRNDWRLFTKEDIARLKKWSTSVRTR